MITNWQEVQRTNINILGNLTSPLLGLLPSASHFLHALRKGHFLYSICYQQFPFSLLALLVFSSFS